MTRRFGSEAEQLEMENRKLEERLRELKDSLKKQKEAREVKGGYSWKSGKVGGLATHSQGVLSENSRRRMEGRKMKILQVVTMVLRSSQNTRVSVMILRLAWRSVFDAHSQRRMKGLRM